MKAKNPEITRALVELRNKDVASLELKPESTGKPKTSKNVLNTILNFFLKKSSPVIKTLTKMDQERKEHRFTLEYGNAEESEQIKDVNLIYPGQVLRLPIK